MGRDGVSPRIVIAGYERFELLGSGGFSTVWRAYQPRFRRFVAVKILAFDVVDDAAIRSFERECHAMGQVSEHPNIVTILDSGFTDDDRPYIVMEYFAGGTYSDRLAAGPIPVEEILRLGVKISGALQTAHDAGVLHRDIKPHNIFVSKFGEPALGDFGISKIDQERTATGFAGYTVHYAPPEVLDGRKVTPRSDLYSLGATLYRLIDGVRPFDGPDQSMVATAVRVITEPAPTVENRECPERLKVLVEALMAKDPADRPGSAGEVAAELQAIQRDEGFHVTHVALATVAGMAGAGAIGAVTQDSIPTTLRDALDEKVTEDPTAAPVTPSDVDPDATIARDSLTVDPAIGTRPPGPVSGGGELVDVADTDATIARDSLAGYNVDDQHAPASKAHVPDAMDAPEVDDVAGEDIEEPQEEAVAHQAAVEEDESHSDGAERPPPEPVPGAVPILNAEVPQDPVDTDATGPDVDKIDPEDTRDAEPKDREDDSSEGDRRVSVTIVETPQHGKRWKYILAASLAAIVVSAVGLTAILTTNGTTTAAPAPAPTTTTAGEPPPTTRATTTSPLPPPLGVEAVFVDSSTVRVAWSTAGGQEGDLYIVKLQGESRYAIEGPPVIFDGVDGDTACPSVTRSRSSQLSERSIVCTESEFGEALADPVDKALEDLVVGDCALDLQFMDTLIWDDVVEVVDCGNPHRVEVFKGGKDPGFSEAFAERDQLLAQGNEQCIPAFETYVGTDYDSSKYYFQSISDVDLSAQEEGRRLVCLLYAPSDGSDSTLESAAIQRGSAKGSKE